jgi:peptidoglycan/xylan/chitin deacetylase (PgdA/CDA1 family)
MSRLLFWICGLFAMACSHGEGIVWPNGARAAVSLSYDDTLNSQLDNAAPILDKHGIKASFYLILSSEVLFDRMDEWRMLAAKGHELGNHTIYHPCSAAQPDRDWVRPHNNMDQRTVEQMRDEVRVANTFLKAIDGRRERTLTPPCGDVSTRDGNYLDHVKDLVVAVKGSEAFPAGIVSYDIPSDVTGRQLIAIVERAAKRGGFANIIFHGIGGDHLTVSTQAHAELIAHLAANRQTYWTDTYMSIMKHVLGEQRPR